MIRKILFLIVLITFISCSTSKSDDKNKDFILGKTVKFERAKLIFDFNEDFTYTGEVIQDGNNNNRFFGVYTFDKKTITLSSPYGDWQVPYRISKDKISSSTLGKGIVMEKRKLPPLKTFDKDEIREINGIFAKDKVSDKEIREYIDNLSLEEKIGQMFTIGFWGDEDLNSEYIDFIEKNHIGGVLVYSRNVLSYNHLIKITNDLKILNNKGSNIPLLIAIDNEGAYRVQLPANIPQGMLNSKISQYINKEDNYLVGVEVGKLLYKLGINMNYGTIADIDFADRDDGFMKLRAYGNNPDLVSDYAIRYSRGNKEEGITPVYKHFPGHGKTNTDSHYKLPKITLDEKELDMELLPYKKAIEEGNLDAIMTAHIIIDGIDELPATLSKPILTGILREKLAFDGVIITDDIEMAAIKNYFDLGEATVKTVEAGTDIVLVCHTIENQRIAYDALLEAVTSGRITEKRIDESVFRILSLKKKYNYTDSINPYLDIEKEAENMGEFLEKLNIKI